MNEWEKESDVYLGIVNGYNYAILRNGLGCLCGYLIVHRHHPWFGKQYEELEDVVVHGGITYSADKLPDFKKHYYDGPRAVGFEQKVDFYKAGWALGFDCSHLGDFAPNTLRMSGLESYKSKDEYRNFTYVYSELVRLADQAARAVPLIRSVSECLAGLTEGEENE